MTKFKLIPADKCIKGRIYKLHCRNLKFGIYNGKGGFIGIRTKFGDRFLDTELHRDNPWAGTVNGIIDLRINLPKGIPVVESLGSKDLKTGRCVSFDTPISEGGIGWFFIDTGISSKNIRPIVIDNSALFNFLKEVEKK